MRNALRLMLALTACGKPAPKATIDAELVDMWPDDRGVAPSRNPMVITARPPRRFRRLAVKSRRP